MTTTDIDAEVAAIAARYRQLGEVIADLAQQRDDLKARFESLVPVGYEAEVDGELVYRKPPARSFNLNAGLDVAEALGIPFRVVETVDVNDLKARLKAVGRLDDAMLPGIGKDRVKL